MTRLRTKIESGNTLSELSKIIGLHEYVLLGIDVETQKSREEHSNICEDIFEAFMASLNIETSYDVCKKFLINLIETELDISTLINMNENYKEQLMQYFHKNGIKTAPEYKNEKYTDSETDKTIYIAEVIHPIDRYVIETGVDLCRKSAEQSAAKNALKKLKENSDDIYIDNNSDSSEFYDID